MVVTPEPVNVHRVLTTRDASRYTGLSMRRLRELADVKQIGCVRAPSGRLMGFQQRHLDEFIAARTHEAQGPKPRVRTVIRVQQVEPIEWVGERVFD